MTRPVERNLVTASRYWIDPREAGVAVVLSALAADSTTATPASRGSIQYRLAVARVTLNGPRDAVIAAAVFLLMRIKLLPIGVVCALSPYYSSAELHELRRKAA